MGGRDDHAVKAGQLTRGTRSMDMSSLSRRTGELAQADEDDDEEGSTKTILVAAPLTSAHQKMSRDVFPLSEVVGNERLKLALLLAAVSLLSSFVYMTLCDTGAFYNTRQSMDKRLIIAQIGP